MMDRFIFKRLQVLSFQGFAKKCAQTVRNLLHVVGKATHQFAAALLVKAGQVHAQRAAVELLAQT